MRAINATVVSGVSICVGSWLGIQFERARRKNTTKSPQNINAVASPCNDTSVIHDNSLQYYLRVPTVEASTHVNTPPMPPRTDQLVPSQPGGFSPVKRATEIMQHGYPSTDQLKYYDNYVLSYDRRNRTAHWVFEHLRPDQLDRDKKVTDRSKSNFTEESTIHPFFRSTNRDYKNSGYDRGHLAAAGNHRHSQQAMDQTFFLCNISPQVGKGFNRNIWNDLEKYSRSVGRKNRNVYVCTGPLYLPRRENDGKLYVKYEVIGANHVAVPTHFFKVLLIENNSGDFELQSFLMPNMAIAEGTPLKNFLIPVETIERAAGFMLFDRLPKSKLKYINGKKI